MLLLLTNIRSTVSLTDVRNDLISLMGTVVLVKFTFTVKYLA